MALAHGNMCFLKTKDYRVGDEEIFDSWVTTCSPMVGNCSCAMISYCRQNDTWNLEMVVDSTPKELAHWLYKEM